MKTIKKYWSLEYKYGCLHILSKYRSSDRIRDDREFTLLHLFHSVIEASYYIMEIVMGYLLHNTFSFLASPELQYMSTKPREIIIGTVCRAKLMIIFINCDSALSII